MKYLHLVWAALFRRKTRTLFTLLSILAAFLLFGLLDSVRMAFANAGGSIVGADRLVTMSKVSFTLSLPKSLLPRIQAVPGVAEVSYANWFGGIYQEPKNFFANEAVADNFLDLYPEWLMPEEIRIPAQPTARITFSESRCAPVRSSRGMKMTPRRIAMFSWCRGCKQRAATFLTKATSLFRAICHITLFRPSGTGLGRASCGTASAIALRHACGRRDKSHF